VSRALREQQAQASSRKELQLNDLIARIESTSRRLVRSAHELDALAPQAELNHHLHDGGSRSSVFPSLFKTRQLDERTRRERSGARSFAVHHVVSRSSAAQTACACFELVQDAEIMSVRALNAL
jgi:hypothetical protein